jgi:hypothetical protein
VRLSLSYFGLGCEAPEESWLGVKERRASLTVGSVDTSGPGLWIEVSLAKIFFLSSSAPEPNCSFFWRLGFIFVSLVVRIQILVFLL